MTKTFVGVSGFSYTAWKGLFYPSEMKNEEFLSFYASRLGSVEINSSFYATPGSAIVKGWASKTGERFRFSLKAPKQITHVLKLGEGSAVQAERLSKIMGLLGPRRGPILFQLPPYLKANLDLLEDFLARTSMISPRVFEFRHPSWFADSTYDLLDRNGAGFCIADTEDLGPVFRATGGVTYFRLRKEAYEQEEVDSWAGRIQDVSKGSEECFVYLRHDETGQNAIFAQGLAKTLGVSHPG